MLTFAQSFDFSSIIQILDIVLLVGFIALIVFFVVAIIIGLCRGIFSSAFRFIMLLSLVLIAVLTMQPLVDFIGNFDLSMFGRYLVITNQSGQSITVVVSTTFNTMADAIAAAMYLNGFNADVITISTLAVQFTTMILKYVILLVDIILILTLGNIFISLLWHFGFKRLIPKLARKMVKVRWLSAIFDGVRYLVVSFMMIAPLSSLVNTMNQTWQKYKPDSDNEIVQTVGSFLDTYNNSLLAQTLFNWSYNSETGLTFDATIISFLTSTSFADGEMSLFEFLNSVGGVGSAALDIFKDSDAINISNLFTTESLVSVFSALNNFELLPYLLPLGFSIAVNALTLEDIDVSGIDFSTVDWKDELERLETIIIDIANSGIVSNFIDENGEVVTNVDINDMIKSMFSDTAYTYTIRIFDSIDESELLSQLIPLVMSYVAKASPQIGVFLPQTYQECRSIKWGFELSVLYDRIYRLLNVDDTLLDALLHEFAPQQTILRSNEGQTGGNNFEDLIEIITNNIDAFKSILIGQFDRNGNLLNCNEDGYTIARQRSDLSLFDLNLFRGIYRPLTEMIVDALAENMDPSFVDVFEDAFDNLFDGPVVKNFKIEFGAIFDCLKDISTNETLLDGLLNGNFDTLLNVSRQDANKLAEIVEGLDRSSILSSVLKPILHQTISSPDFDETLSTIGLDGDSFNVLECDDICGEMAKIVRALPSIIRITNLLEEGTNAIANIGEYGEDIAYVLDTVFISEILNPNFDKNSDNNFYRVIGKLFDMIRENGINGLSFKRDEVNQELGYQKWNNSLTPEGDYPRDNLGNPIYDGEIGDLINALNALSVVNKTIGSPFYGKTLLECFTESNDDMANIIGALETEFHISNVFACIEESALLKPTFGEFIDSILLEYADFGLIDFDAGRTFTNVDDWAYEGKLFGQMCSILGDLEISLENLQILDFDNFEGLNRLLHSIAELSIFNDPLDSANGTTIPDFLFDKIKEALVTPDLDLLSDEYSTPDNKTFNKAMEDFQIQTQSGQDIIAQKDDWSSPEWIDAYLDSNETYDVDSDFYTKDLISRACQVLKSLDVMKRNTEIVTGQHYQNYIEALTSGYVPAEELTNVLTYINNFQPFRMVVYHAFDLIFSTVSTGGFIDFSNSNTRYLALDSTSAQDRKNEIDRIMGIYDFYFENLKDTANFDFVEFAKNPARLINLHNLVSVFVESYIFHQAGPKDGEGLTTFQSLMKFILTLEGLRDMIYSDNPLSRDQSSFYQQYYSDVYSKAEYMVSVEHFDFTFTLGGQKAKIDQLFELISSFVGGPVDIANADEDGLFTLYEGLIGSSDSNIDFSSINIKTVSTTALRDVFINLNNSDLLYESIPNSISSLLATEEGSLLGDIANSCDPYYAYYLVDSSNPNFNARYSIEEIDLIIDLIERFEEMSSHIDNANVTNLLGLEDGEFNLFMTELENLFADLYNSYVFHQFNNIKGIEKFSSFESLFERIFVDTSLSTIVYNPEVDSAKYNPYGTLTDQEASKVKIESAIKALSAQDHDYNYGSGNLNTIGFSDVWYDNDASTTDEVRSFIDFFKAAKKLNINNFENISIDITQVDVFNPENIESVLLSLNKVDIAEGAVASLIKQLMGETAISQYSTYNGVDYADYFLTQREYASVNGLPLLVEFLRDVSTYEDGVFVSYNILNKLADDPFHQFIEKGGTSASLLNFITHSLIYTHDSIVLDNGEMVMDDAIIFYNLFTPNSGSVRNISDYIYGDDEDTKICTLNHLIHHFDYHPEYDGNAIDVLIMSNFNDKSFEAGDFESIKLVKDVIYKGLVALTHEDGEITNVYRGRAFIASEILAGIIDEFVVSELEFANYGKTESDPYYLNYSDFLTRKTIDNKPITHYMQINESSYDLLNADEARGINAILSMYAGNSLEDYITLSRDDMRDYFELMEYCVTDTGVNSRFASLIYVSRIRTIFDLAFSTAKFLGYNQTYFVKSTDDLLSYKTGFINFGNDIIGALDKILSFGLGM